MTTQRKKINKLDKMLSSLSKEEELLLDKLDKNFSLPEKRKKTKLFTLTESAVDNTLKKKRTINLRISEQDLHRLKVKAAEIGVGYNGVITMLLKRYLKKI